MDEVVAYAEGFLSAFFYAPITAPGTGTPAWLAHFEGFTKEFHKARANAAPIPKNTKGIAQENLAIRQSANAVIPESEKQVKEYCDKAGKEPKTWRRGWSTSTTLEACTSPRSTWSTG